MSVQPLVRRGGAGSLLVLTLLVAAAAAGASIGFTAAHAATGSPLSSTAATSIGSVSPGASGARMLLPGSETSVTAQVPTTGTPPYSWQWLFSTDGGQSYRNATSAQCATPRGSDAPAGVEEDCVFRSTPAIVPGTYQFELRVLDSATTPESALSVALATVTVPTSTASGTGSGGRAPQFDTDPQEDCTGGCDAADWFGGTGGSGALAITTTSTDELLILEVTDSGQFTADLSTADISDTQGSTWTLEPVHDWDGFGHEQYVFYAIDAAAASDTVTIDSTSTHTTTTTATAVLSAFSGVDTGAPIAAVGTFETGTATQSSASVTASVAPTTILGVVSTTNGASAFTPTSSPAFAEAGTINDASATASFVEYYADTSTGTYTSEPTWTGSVHWGAEAIAIEGANPLSVTVSPTAEVLDQGQSATITATEAGGSGGPSYSWSVLSGSCPGFSNSGSSSLSYSPSGTTTNCVLTVTVEDSADDSAQPATSASVTVNSALGTPATPTPNAALLDLNQAETVTGTIPTGGTATYSWSWLVAIDGGGYSATTQCATNSGAGAAASATETCAIAAGRLTAGDSYNFALKVTDSATTPEITTSAGSVAVDVSSTLVGPSAPTVSATLLDVNQAFTAGGTVSTTGTAPYAWTWMVSVNGGAYAAATECATGGGTGAIAGAAESCSVSSGTLTAGDTYSFELRVTDSATTAESATSVASSTVHVKAALGAPAAPTVSAVALDANQPVTISGTIPSSGTAPYSWQWYVSVNGAAYAAAGACATGSGSGASGGATETCAIATGALTPGDAYSFELVVTDSATTEESATSAASMSVSVASALVAPDAPGTSAATLDANQALTIQGTVPTTGSSPYSWEWLVSVNGAAYVATTFCAVNSQSGAIAGSTATCTVAAGTLAVGSTYAFELEVTDAATASETVTSLASATVSVNTALTAPAVPTLSATALDANQAEVVTGSIPSSGTGPYSWEWLVSVNGGTEGIASECATDEGAWAAAGAVETCSIAADSLAAGDHYSFTLEVTDRSGAGGETENSGPSDAVAVSAALTAPSSPTLSNSTVSRADTLTATGTLPSDGTPDLAWQWMVSENGGTYADASLCGSSQSGTDAAAGTVVHCTVPSGSLAPGSSYTFELAVTDSASLAERVTSAASLAVTVVGPAISVGTAQGPVGAEYQVVGTGFSPASTVTVSFGSALLTPTACSDGSFSGTEITTDANGGFACSFTVPTETPGVYSVLGTDTASSSTTLAFSFTVTTPEVTVFPLHGQVGDTVTVNGTGFSVSTSLASLVFGSLAITSCRSGTLTTNASGAFSCTFMVPSGTSGSAVVATDVGGATATATYTLATAATAPASTGFADWAWVVLAGVVLAALLVVLGVRRRRSTRGDVGSGSSPDRPASATGAETSAPPVDRLPPADAPGPGSWATMAPEGASSEADSIPFSLLAFAPASTGNGSAESHHHPVPSATVETPAAPVPEHPLEPNGSPGSPEPTDGPHGSEPPFELTIDMAVGSTVEPSVTGSPDSSTPEPVPIPSPAPAIEGDAGGEPSAPSSHPEAADPVPEFVDPTATPTVPVEIPSSVPPVEMAFDDGPMWSPDPFPTLDSPSAETRQAVLVPPIVAEPAPVPVDVTSIAVPAPSCLAMVPMKDGRPMREIAPIDRNRSLSSAG